jgi:hypothetical protein
MIIYSPALKRLSASMFLAFPLQEFLEGEEYIVDAVSRDGVYKVFRIVIADHLASKFIESFFSPCARI